MLALLKSLIGKQADKRRTMRKSKTYGTGRVFRRGRRYWLAYYLNGQEHRESAGTTDFKEAVEILKRRTAGVDPTVTRQDLDIERLVELIETDYQQEGRKSLATLRRSRFPHLRDYFGKRDLASVDKHDLRAYRTYRLEQDASSGSVNREVATLMRMLRIAYDQNQLDSPPPTIKKLTEHNVRKGFFEWEAFQKVLTHVDAWWHELYIVAYVTGWRIDAEICQMQWAQVDFRNKMIRLEPGTTKNDEGRTFGFTPMLQKALQAQRARVDRLQTAHDKIIQWVFPRRFTLQALTSAYKPFKAAAIAAGLPAALQHDFRRTAIRNLELAGVDRATAKMMVGHRTDSVYERYNIVDRKRLDIGTKKLAEFEEMVKKESA
jgi:integrase